MYFLSNKDFKIKQGKYNLIITTVMKNKQTNKFNDYCSCLFNNCCYFCCVFSVVLLSNIKYTQDKLIQK